jgi:large subunit ribosomal protein L13
MGTKAITPENIQRKWYIVDAENKILGRLATEAAKRLRGKHKPEYTPNMDLGDYVIIINAEKVRVTGNKKTDKMYYHYTGHPGGIKSINFEKLIAKKPELVITKAIHGMIPKGPLGRQMLKKLKVYAGSEHPHHPQQPEILNIEAD